MAAQNTISVIDISFAKIHTMHRQNHSSQIDNIVQFLTNRLVNKKKIAQTKKLLIEFERIFWCIDDVIDNQYSDSTMKISNEIVKFVSFLGLFEQILNYQLGNRADFFSILQRKKLLSQKLLQIIYDHLQELVSIPDNEKKIETQILQTTDINQLKSLVIANQRNRTLNLKIYLGITEVFTDVQINFALFSSFRALQLILEDAMDKYKDKLHGNNNCVNMLEAKGLPAPQISDMLSAIMQFFLEEIEHESDQCSSFLVKKAIENFEKFDKIMTSYK